MLLSGDGTAGPYQFKDHLIFQETDRVEKNGELLIRNQDYYIDYNRGQITLSASIYPPDTLYITYEKLNLNLRKRYFHRELLLGQNQTGESVFSSSSGIKENQSQGRKWALLPERGSSDLALSGSKTFSFEVGSSRDPLLKQGLWISAKGQATRDVELSLQLSDQNMPATYDGTSKRLDELDQVQMQVSSPNFSGTLGDYYLRSSGSELSSYDKKLQGVTAKASTGQASASFALASSGGEYFTNRFYGEENKQGPYQLVGKNGETGINILAGTERVWVDGERMERGSGGDFTIDYGSGTIEFTPRKLITSDSRITVDFEYSSDSYERNLYAGDVAGAFLGGKAELKVSGILERDDSNHPNSFSLSSEDRQVLKAAGDQRQSASKEGAVFVGEGEGDYDLAYDSTGNPYYRYAGSESGSYQVSFSWMGAGKGSYKYEGGGVYRYVYPGNGGYSPVVILPLPQSHSLFDMSFSVLPADEFKTTVEWARSSRDQNTLSDIDDEHNQGDAISVKSVYQNSDFQLVKSGFHQLQLQGEYRLIHADFSPFGRVNSVEKVWEWGLAEESLTGNERTCLFSGLIAPWKSLSLDFDFGNLKQGETSAADRFSLGAEILPVKGISVKGSTERINSRSVTDGEQAEKDHWTRNSLVLAGRHRIVSTEFSWSRQRRLSSFSESAAERDDFDQLAGEVSCKLSTGIKTSTGLTYRKDAETDEGRSRSLVWSNRVSLQDFKNMISSDLEFTRRVKKYKSSDDAGSKLDLVMTRVDFYPPSQLVNVSFYHSQNQIHSGQRVDSYLEVEEGKGDYVYQEGRYVSHPEGNFVRLSEWVGETRPSLDLNKSIRLIFSPHKVSTGGSLWHKMGKIFSTDSFINLHGRLADDRSLANYFLHPLIQVPDQSILQQNLITRHDLYLIPTQKSLDLRLRWEKEQEVDGLLSDEKTEEETEKQELLIKAPIFRQHYLELEIGRETIDETEDGNPQGLIKGKSVELGFTRVQAKTLELKVSTGYRQREEQIRCIKVDFSSLAPELTWSLLTQGRLRAKLQWTYLESNPKDTKLPYILTEGKMPGHNYDWRLFFDYKLSRFLTTSVAYSGESISSGSTQHTAKAEVQASF